MIWRGLLACFLLAVVRVDDLHYLFKHGPYPRGMARGIDPKTWSRHV